MRSRNSGIAPLIAVILVVALIFVSVYAFRHFSPKPPIEVVYSLEPSTIKEKERAHLILTLNNVDLSTHEIGIVFDISHRISVHEGSERLLQENMYSFVLEAADPSEQRVFTVSGSLEEGTLSSQYPISFRVFVDGNELRKTWGDPILTVQKP